MHADSATSTVTLTATDVSVVRVVQVTDCHIMADAQDCLKGMNTRDSFEAVSASALADRAAPDLMLATGDLSQDASPASYRYLAAQFEATGVPLFWLPGNHDNASVMREHLRGELIFSQKQVLVANWLILLLDSSIDGESAGELSASQIDFLQTALRTHSHRHALVCLHHQPLPAGSEWIDDLGLRQARNLTDTVAAHANVRGVLWGHVHQQSHQCRDGIEWMSTPSTCVQFKPGSRTFALDDLGPGYRQLDLHADGRISTGVHHIEGFEQGCSHELL